MSSYTIQERTTGESIADGALISGPLPTIGSTLRVLCGVCEEVELWQAYEVVGVVHDLTAQCDGGRAARVTVVVEQVP